MLTTKTVGYHFVKLFYLSLISCDCPLKTLHNTAIMRMIDNDIPNDSRKMSFHLFQSTMIMSSVVSITEMFVL